MRNWILVAWRRLILTGLLATAGGLGFSFGKFETDRLVLSAGEAAYGKGKAETETILFAQFSVEKENVRREADSDGYKRGQADSERELRIDDRQTKLLAEIFAYIEYGRESSNISAQAGTELQAAIKAAQEGDFELASRTLDNPTSNVEIGACIPTDQAVEIEKNKTIDHCESKVEIAFVGFDGTGEQSSIGLRLNGRFDRLAIGERSRLSNDTDCYVTFLRIESYQDVERPVIRFGCKE